MLDIKYRFESADSHAGYQIQILICRLNTSSTDLDIHKSSNLRSTFDNIKKQEFRTPLTKGKKPLKKKNKIYVYTYIYTLVKKILKLIFDSFFINITLHFTMLQLTTFEPAFPLKYLIKIFGILLFYFFFFSTLNIS